MVRLIQDAGTPESVWLPWLDALPSRPLDLSAPPARAVVVAPHPDDEILALGGLLQLLSAAGSEVVVVAVTDGEASHPGGSLTPAKLARRRIMETEQALHALGVSATVQRLELPDGGAADLEAPVSQALSCRSGDWLLAPWEHDGHPDHEAVGRACRAVADRDGARLVPYPIWAWHWAQPADLPPLRSVPLPAPVRAAKERAVQCFVTQVTPTGPRPQDAPILPPHVLARFRRDIEVVFG